MVAISETERARLGERLTEAGQRRMSYREIADRARVDVSAVRALRYDRRDEPIRAAELGRIDAALTALGVPDGAELVAIRDRRSVRAGSVTKAEADAMRPTVARMLEAALAAGGNTASFAKRAGVSWGTLYPFVKNGKGMSRRTYDKIRAGLGLDRTADLVHAVHAIARPDAGYPLAELGAVATLPARSAAELVESWMDAALEIVLAEARGAR